MNAIAVRLATGSDAVLLLGMMEEFNRIEEIEWTPAQGEAPLRRLLSDPGLGVAGILEEHEVAVGYFVMTWGFDLEWNGRDAFLTELYLVPQARGRGLGRPFLAAIEAIARDNGVHALHLMVRPENAAARRLYESAGYECPPRIFLTKAFR